MTHRLMFAAVARWRSRRACPRSRPARRKRAAQPARPDLSGSWSVTLGLPTGSALKRQEGGVTKTASIDRVKVQGAIGQGRGALPWTAAPSYKPEFQAKVAQLEANQSKTDPVFYCARPGVPRVGPPRKIVQLRDEVDLPLRGSVGRHLSRDPDRRPRASHRRQPLLLRRLGGEVGRRHAGDRRPQLRGGHLVRREGIFPHRRHARDRRLWLDGDNLVWQATVHDPNVLAAPWTLAPRMIARSAQPLEESPPCHEQDGGRLLNTDHHVQR